LAARQAPRGQLLQTRFQMVSHFVGDFAALRSLEPQEAAQQRQVQFEILFRHMGSPLQIVPTRWDAEWPRARAPAGRECTRHIHATRAPAATGACDRFRSIRTTCDDGLWNCPIYSGSACPIPTDATAGTACRL